MGQIRSLELVFFARCRGSRTERGCLPAGGGLLKEIAEARGAPWPAFTSFSEKFEPGVSDRNRTSGKPGRTVANPVRNRRGRPLGCR